MQADTAGQHEETARLFKLEMHSLRQRHCEELAMVENKYQHQLTQQGARLQEQHEAGVQRLRDAAGSQQAQLEALQAQLDSQVHSDAWPAVHTSSAVPEQPLPPSTHARSSLVNRL